MPHLIRTVILLSIKVFEKSIISPYSVRDITKFVPHVKGGSKLGGDPYRVKWN